MKTSVYLCALITLSLLVSSAYGAFPDFPSNGLSMVSGSNEARQCMGKQVPSATSDSLQSKYGIRTQNASSSFVDQGIATAAERLNALGRPDILKGLTVSLYKGGKPTGSRCSSVTTGIKSISLVFNCDKGDGAVRNANAASVSLNLLHEAGHAVGNAGAYGKYFGAVNPPCTVSKYCTHNSNKNKRNEEFAEVFAAFVHSPSLLQHSTNESCRNAYKFMANSVFGRTSGPGICTGVPGQAVAAGDLNMKPSGPNDVSNNLDIGSQGKGLNDAMLAFLPFLSKGEEFEGEGEHDSEDYNPTHGTTVLPKNISPIGPAHPPGSAAQ